MKTYIKRALRTFAQTAVGYISVNICTTDLDATSTGTKGDIAYDSGYMYVCTDTNVWKRTALTTW